MDFAKNPYPAGRMPVMASHGMVATSQPLAAQAGLSMLQRGGNAVDAILATAITLSVVEPTSNGIGSDAFAIVSDGQQLHGLNGSGRAPASSSADALRAVGHTAMPQRGWHPVTVPGTPRMWADLHGRFGRLPFATVFEPAIWYAEQGFPVSPITAAGWQSAAAQTVAPFRNDPLFSPWFDVFAPGGHAPRAGETWRSPDHAATLRRIAASNASDFYDGDTAEAIDRFARATGGLLRGSDLAAHHSEWVDPIHTTYRGHDVWELPPNGWGIATLLGLNILSELPLRSHPRDTAEAYHLQIESLKLAFADARRYVADPAMSEVPVAGLLDPAYAAERRKLIGEGASNAVAGAPRRGGTVYLCAADGDGMMVSFIQSNYNGFGSGIVPPGTGVALHNRGYGFTLEEGHPNELAPGKRPFHTIIPGFLTRDGIPIGPFGVMGAFMQAQGHVQMIVNTLDYDLNPQASLDAPRWRFDHGTTIKIEPQTDAAIIDGLRQRGHTVEVDPALGNYGRGQIIWRLKDGNYVAGSDPRADGAAIGF
ncbi:MAG TPA: gamma-glutamyltransferase family protein [Chloroflexota bacterium]|nr:gamma-glutamyltransferase family protein [Chloroflexota bacterium]